jgi:hypothetical protein
MLPFIASLSLKVIASVFSSSCQRNDKTKVSDEPLGSFDAGGFTLGLLKTAAVKGIIPAGNKVRELRSNLLRLVTRTATVMEERFGPAGRDAVAEIFRRLGEEDAKTMKEQLDLGDTLQDSLDAWLVIGHMFGSRMAPKWVSENHVDVSHSYCPQHEELVKNGKLYCIDACLPYVGAVGENIGKGVKMNVVRAADEHAPCIKSLSIQTRDIE